MQNEIYRKYTSITLMAIMVAGGLTFAVPGTDPVFAQTSASNPNLYVSAEGQDPDNIFAEGNIIEVIIRDDSIGDTDEGEAEPEVTVNGADLRMLQTANGYWTAYFAEVDALADAAESLPYGVSCGEDIDIAGPGKDIPLTDSDGIYLPPGSVCSDLSVSRILDDGEPRHPLIREPRGLTDYKDDDTTIGQLGLVNEDLWPFIQVFDFTPEGDVEIVYNKGGDRQTVTLTFDDPSESHSLDRQKYPQGAHVHITLEDYALNIDPTDEDTWVFDTQNDAAYYNLFDEDGDPVYAMDDEISPVGSEAGIDETVSINRGAQGTNVIDCQLTKDFGMPDLADPSQDYLMADDASGGACVSTSNLGAGASDVFAPDNFAIGFVEDGSNNNVFINWAEDQRSNIVVLDGALRGNSFEVDYSSPGAKSGVIGHFFGELTFEDPDGVWNSGERITVTLADEDFNKNPLTEEVASVDVAVGSQENVKTFVIDDDFNPIVIDIVDPLPPDTTDPAIRLTGPSEIRLNVGDTYTEQGATCNDARDGSLTALRTSNAPDTTRAGTYTLEYSCTDAAGNSASVTRVVTVDDPDRPDTDDPVITVNPGTDTITAGDTWTDAGASCTDARDGPLTVTTTGTVTNTSPGTYTITYACEDAAGNSASETRTVTVNARQATITLNVVPGDWDNGVIELDISGTTVNVADGIVTLTSDTIPNFGEYDVAVTSNVISGMIPFANVTVSGTHTFTATTSDGSISDSDTANIPPPLSLTNVVPVGQWIDADNDDDPNTTNDYIALRVAGTESVFGTVSLGVLDEDGELTDKLGLPVEFDENNQARLNIEDTSIQGPTQFVLTTTYAGVTTTSNSWTTPNMPVLLTLDDVHVNEWDNGSLILDITGTKQAIVPNTADTGTFTVRMSGTTTPFSTVAVSGFSDGVVNGTVTLGSDDLSLSGTTVQFVLVENSGGNENFASDPVDRPIPSILTNLQVTTAGSNAGQWNGGNFEVRVTGSSDGIAETTQINLEADIDGAWIEVVEGGTTSGLQILTGGDIRATVSLTDVRLYGDTVFRLVTDGANGAASANSTAVRIPHILTSLPTVTPIGDWSDTTDGQLTINVKGISGLPDSPSLQLQAVKDNAFVPVGDANSDSTGGNYDYNATLSDISLSGTTTTFRLDATVGTNTVMSGNVTGISIPPALTLADVSFGSGWANDTSDVLGINLFVTGNSKLSTGATLQVSTDGEAWTNVGEASTAAGDITDAVVRLTDTELAGERVQFRLDTGTDPIAVSNTLSRVVPALPASSSSVDMAPTPISFSAQNGFPPITRAVINDISEIPAVHNVQTTPNTAPLTFKYDPDTNTISACGTDSPLYVSGAFQYQFPIELPPAPYPTTSTSGASTGGAIAKMLDPYADTSSIVDAQATPAAGPESFFTWDFSVDRGFEIVGVSIEDAAGNELWSTDESSGQEFVSGLSVGGTGAVVVHLIQEGPPTEVQAPMVDGPFPIISEFDPENGVNNAAYRIELEETSADSGVFEGTIEYVMLNQLNIGKDSGVYDKLRIIGEDVLILVDADMTAEDSIRIQYTGLGADGVLETVTAQQEAPTHSGVVSLDSESYKIADTVTITVEDADLNVDNDVIDIYSITSGLDTIGDATAGTLLLDVTFDDETWTVNGCTDDEFGGADTGLGDTGFTLIETAQGSGVFTGTFQIPSVYCQAPNTSKNNGDPTIRSVTGVDIEVNYQDFRDASGSEIEVGAGASVRANTGTVSFDRTVYPVPIPGDSNIEDASGTEYGQRDLTVQITISDPDFDQAPTGIDTVSSDVLELTVSRGSFEGLIPIPSQDIFEVAPTAGAFELDWGIPYMVEVIDMSDPNRPLVNFTINQGDILQVEYNDPTDASGNTNTVTDSATFDLRNGVLQSDKSVYIIGSDMILTLIEPDFDLDSDSSETYPLNLIEWDSDAATLGLGQSDKFDPEPSGLRETGSSTGIFQVVVEIPDEIDGDRLERGEEIELEYVDHGPSGADYVGDETEDVTLTVFTSNFGATIELDQKVYTWTDKVYITIVAPDHNFDSALIDEIGESSDDPIQVSTRSDDIDNYRLVETGPDTGIFTGEVILIGFDHNADGDTETGTEAGYDNPQRDTSDDGAGPTNGYLATDDDDGITVSFEYSEDETIVGSALIRWNIGEVQWLESSYPASGTGVVRVIDPDMNWDPEAVNNFVVDVWSDADNGGIDLTVTETNEATGIFEGTVFFTITDESSGHRLRVAEGNTVTAEYEDNTLPDPYTTADELDITATTLIGTIVPPLERAPATNLRIVDAFGNSLDTVSADQQVQIVADLANGQDRSQAFAYLVQVQDANGVTVALSWISGTLEAGQSLSPSTSWIPSEAGTYTATAFVWESVDNPTALSPPVTTDITVS